MQREIFPQVTYTIRTSVVSRDNTVRGGRFQDWLVRRHNSSNPGSLLLSRKLQPQDAGATLSSRRGTVLLRERTLLHTSPPHVSPASRASVTRPETITDQEECGWLRPIKIRSEELNRGQRLPPGGHRAPEMTMYSRPCWRGRGGAVALGQQPPGPPTFLDVTDSVSTRLHSGFHCSDADARSGGVCVRSPHGPSDAPAPPAAPCPSGSCVSHPRATFPGITCELKKGAFCHSVSCRKSSKVCLSSWGHRSPPFLWQDSFIQSSGCFLVSPRACSSGGLACGFLLVTWL